MALKKFDYYYYYYYLRHGGYVFIGFSLLFVGRITQKNYLTNFYKIRRNCSAWATEGTVRFWW